MITSLYPDSPWIFVYITLSWSPTFSFSFFISLCPSPTSMSLPQYAREWTSSIANSCIHRCMTYYTLFIHWSMTYYTQIVQWEPNCVELLSTPVTHAQFCHIGPRISFILGSDYPIFLLNIFSFYSLHSIVKLSIIIYFIS